MGDGVRHDEPARRRPVALERISSPLDVSGQAESAGAEIAVQLRQDGLLTALATASATGGTAEAASRFTAVLAYPTPTAAAGALVFETLAPQNGAVLAATVIRVHYSG